jgi:hypothetical protein
MLRAWNKVERPWQYHFYCQIRDFEMGLLEVLLTYPMKPVREHCQIHDSHCQKWTATSPISTVRAFCLSLKQYCRPPSLKDATAT